MITDKDLGIHSSHLKEQYGVNSYALLLYRKQIKDGHRHLQMAANSLEEVTKRLTVIKLYMKQEGIEFDEVNIDGNFIERRKDEH